MALINEIDVLVSELKLIGSPPTGWNVAFAVTARNGEKFVVSADISLSDNKEPEDAVDTARSLLENQIIQQASRLEEQSSSLVGTSFQIEMPEPFEVEDEPEEELGEEEVSE